MNPNPEQPRERLIVNQVALVLAVLLVLARATFVQSLRDPDLVSPGDMAIPRNAGATTGLILDLLLCVPALLVLLQRVISREFRLRFSMSSLLLLLLGALAAASTFWAADSFSAAIHGAHLLSAAILLWSMVQLIRSWAHVRLVAAGCFAILLICLAQGAIYRLVELKDVQRTFQETKAEQLARRGWAADSFQATQFEIRVMGGELLGFATSPNTFAALIVLVSVIGAGVVIQRVSSGDEPGWPMAILALMAPSAWILYHTGSRTAGGALLIAVAMLLVAPSLTRRKLVYFAALAVVAGGVALVISYGVTHDGLIHSSLTFRWYYWVGAARLLLEHPLLGIGWTSFGDYYPAVRMPIASEEVKDPHNLVVRAFVELGIVGGLLMIGWLLRMVWEITGPAALTARPPTERRIGGISNHAIIWIVVGAMLVNVAASVDFTLDSPDAVYFILMELFKRLLFLVLGLLGMGLVLLKSSGGKWLDERPAPWILRAMVVGALVFLICNLVDFSIFEPGPMFVAAMVIGTALGAKLDARRAMFTSRIGPGLVLAGAFSLWLAAALGVAVPVAIAEQAAHEADTQIRKGRPATAGETFRRAFEMLWIENPDYALRGAVAMQHAGSSAERVRAMLDSAIDANPRSAYYARARAELELRLPQPDVARLMAEYERVLKLDPANVPARLDFATALARFNQPTRAAEQYRQALRFNDLLDSEEPKRLTPEQVEQVEQQIRDLGG